MRRFLAAAAVFLLAAAAAGAQASRGDRLTVRIAVMGPGDQLYFWWGHIALVVEDSFTGENRFFDWGIFSFDSDHFFSNFAMGRLIYRCGVSPAELNFRAYRQTNRDITLYTLDLPPEKRLEILRFAENSVLPENRDYFYHHFRDNCSTRIRDIIDLATDGQFGAAFREMPGRFTLRQHVRRHTWSSPFFDWFLNFLMGQDIDLPLTVWQEMFLPSEAGARLRDFVWTGRDGVERRLVSATEVLSRARGRPAVLDAPRRPWPRELAAGLFMAALLCGVYGFGRKKPGPARVCAGVLNAALGLFWGASGTLLFFMTFFTNHDYTFHNVNIMFVNPLLFAALPLGIRMALDRGTGPFPARRGATRLLCLLWGYVFCAGILSLALRALPWFWQENRPTAALLLPVAFVQGVLLRAWPRGGGSGSAGA